ncbi:hypothetical protein P691DRAFT_847911 [Macrolepiota fuliginosa MF-IS2]|uniref:Uncharacterized protein n=1 Tax=Macrolepiota fuliginosa MF-IS2 TaxID=1400762 RepID=A0A9P5XM98_9AGAR|nr:hypothetical protein P691DRAFT_847911 [Macrolepiota fuliginosa MF-IS2]
MASTIDIFEDPAGEVLESTAGEARADAPNFRAAHQVEVNANLEYQAAGQAASVAKTLGPRYTGEKATSVDKFRNQSENQLENQPEQKLEEAVEEGKRDVASAQAAGSQAIDRVKEVKGITTQGAEGAESAATSAMASAKAAAQNVLGTAGMMPDAQVEDVAAPSAGIPSTSAPLESGSKCYFFNFTYLKSSSNISATIVVIGVTSCPHWCLYRQGAKNSNERFVLEPLTFRVLLDALTCMGVLSFKIWIAIGV